VASLGNASISCGAVHTAVECSVTLRRLVSFICTENHAKFIGSFLHTLLKKAAGKCTDGLLLRSRNVLSGIRRIMCFVQDDRKLWQYNFFLRFGW
jgi:hypothetical protein